MFELCGLKGVIDQEIIDLTLMNKAVHLLGTRTNFQNKFQMIKNFSVIVSIPLQVNTTSSW